MKKIIRMKVKGKPGNTVMLPARWMEGFGRMSSGKKDEAIGLPDVLTILRRVLDSF